MYTYNNKDITNSQFTDDNGVQYPSNWCANASQYERDALGIITVNEVHPTLLSTEKEDGTFTDVTVKLVTTRTYNKVSKTVTEIQSEMTSGVQEFLDQKAQSKGYDSIFTACTYDGDLNPTFAADGLQFKTWRSAVWVHCITVMGEVQAGTRSIPTSEELIAELPVF